MVKFRAGKPGENPIKGEFHFRQDGELVTIPINSTYVVVPKPDRAVVSADKMNVVYRGVVNPMTISFAGVSDNKVVANATGLKKLSNGKYEMRPGSGREAAVRAMGNADSRIGFVHVLTTGATGAIGIDPQVFVFDINLNTIINHG